MEGLFAWITHRDGAICSRDNYAAGYVDERSVDHGLSGTHEGPCTGSEASVERAANGPRARVRYRLARGHLLRVNVSGLLVAARDSAAAFLGASAHVATGSEPRQQIALDLWLQD